MLYEPMQMMKVLLKKEFASKADEEQVDNELTIVMEDIFKLKIGTAVVFALSKKEKEHWKYEDAELAWSEESLSIVSDFWQDDLPEARLRLNKIFKRLSA